MRKKMFAAAAAVSLLVSAGAAAAQSAASLSLAGSPAALEAEGAGELGNRRGLGWLLIPIALGILVFVVVQLQDENDLPGSP